jgi:hypothetical protein
MPRDVAKKSQGTLVLNGASQALVSANPSRTEITICNTAASNAMWLAFSEAGATSTAAVTTPTAVANQGLRLGGGQSYTNTSYRGAIAILGTNLDVATYVEF